MKDILENINNINKVFENRIRLALMSILMVNETVDFNTLKENLNLTDGNLASHLATLERNRYISIHKKFVAKKPVTSYSATVKGRQAFGEHIDALEQIIRQAQ